MPIHESYDESSPEVLRATQLVAAIPDFPEVVVVTYSRIKLEAILDANPHEQVHVINTSAVSIPIYVIEVDGKRIAAHLSTIGGAAAAGIMEEVIAMGGRRFLFFGSCGTLDSDITEGAVVVPTAAWRDEGVSYHYLPPADEIEIETAGKLMSILDELDVPHHETKTWTTDAIYRETRGNMQKRIDAGCRVVEMECASTAAVAKLRKVEFYQFLYGADSLAGDEWDSRTLVEYANDENAALANLAIRIAVRL